MSGINDKPLLCGSLLRIGGQVQGVGFRPFVYRVACASKLTGWVANHGTEVQLLFQGGPKAIEAAVQTLLHDHPPLARPELLEQRQTMQPRHSDFQILTSHSDTQHHPHIPPDYYVCNDCLAEFNDPANRRYRYPFINCTQCGPRYTLITALPYDRPNTTMADFPLCPACRAEYENPQDRRFHAEPIACPECGPHLTFRQGDRQLEGNEESLKAFLDVVTAGGIVAVKGVGGYHLLCDGRNEEAVRQLRQRKARPHKPLAILFPYTGDRGLAAIKQELNPTEAEAHRLCSPMRPIVLCRKQPASTLAKSIAPGLAEVGAMLPYSPLHHLLSMAFDGPLVATSGNISGEPVITEAREAEKHLGRIADAFLHHNRPIQRPADDPVYREIDGALRPLRLGRGNAPLEYTLPVTLTEPLLAVGGEMKNAVALAWDNRLVLSPHIGELHSPRGQQVFERVIDDLQRLYNIRAMWVLHDAHPNYHSSRWARECGLTSQAIPHHHAHASALYGEHWPEDEQWLVATWDGVGYGVDGTLWGGETLLGQPGNWRRFARFRPFRLPGGDKASREPWRSALSLCLETRTDWMAAPAEAELLSLAWQRGLNSPTTTAVGRLFDAASSLLGLGHSSSFEGQGPMQLETLASGSGDPIELPLTQTDEGIWQSDWAPLLPMLLDTKLAVAERAVRFHHSLAQALCQQALKARAMYGITTVGLSGGVFQNRYLVECLSKALAELGFTVKLAERFPCNDAALAWGQIVEAIHTPTRDDRTET